MNKYFRELVYSSANEDTRSELQALKLDGNDEILCITGSGARPLELTLGHTGRIVSVDFNPAQNHLLGLKIAAMQLLNHADYLRFLGVKDDIDPGERNATLLRLADSMPPDTYKFWQTRRAAIARGIIYEGVWERNLRVLSRLSIFRQKTRDGLMQCLSLDEQRHFWRNNWDNRPWRMMLKLASSRFLWRYVAKEPGIECVPSSFDIYDYLYRAFDDAAQNIHFAQEPFAHLLFYGKYTNEQVLPLHLRAEHYETLKQRSGAISVRTASLSEVLTDPANSRRFSAFSLSDFSTYCSPEAYEAIWRQIIQAAAPHAKICERQLFVKLDPAEISGVRLQRNPLLEKSLKRSDTCIFYSFVCGQLA